MKGRSWRGLLRRRPSWQLAFGLSLLTISALAYTGEIAVFHRREDTLFYMLQDFAFVPIQVVLVTLVISELVSRRQRNDLRRKLNMVIGTFFGEAGTPLLRHLSSFDGRRGELCRSLRIQATWTDRDFDGARDAVRSRNLAVDSRRGDLAALKSLLMAQRPFLLSLLENANLLEHDDFSELLWAVFHLTDELGYRTDLDALPASDLNHLSEDIRRAYRHLLVEWLAYVKHLRRDYPYIFSLVVRTNPFDASAQPVVFAGVASERQGGASGDHPFDGASTN